MKNINTDNFLLSSRQIAARLTFTDYRLRFADLGDTDVPSDWSHYDASEYGTGIIQVRTKVGDPNTKIYWRYISDLNGVWPAWTTVTLAAATTDVALLNDMLFVSGKIYTSIFNLAVYTTVPSYPNSLIAPVSATEFYCLSYAAGLCSLYSVKNGVATQFPGGIYESIQPIYFDAVRVNTEDYIYFVKDGGMKTHFLTHQISGTYHNWGAITPLIPMDVVDDISQVRLSSVNVINGKPMVAAVLTRSSGLGMHIYTIGTDSYTLGRDLFVGTTDLNGRAKFFLVGDKVWFIGPGVKFSAPATQFVGYSNAAMEYTTSETISINMPLTKNDVSNTQITMRSNVTHAAIRAGAKCKIEVAAGGVYVTMGTYGVDAVTTASDGNGETITVSLRSLGMKELSNWESDAPYDYWSQTKVNTNPSDLTEVVRTSNLWAQEANGLTTYDLCSKGFMYVAERSCLNGIIEAKFTRTAGDYNGRFGVGLHYTVETPLDTATRLSIKEGDVTENLLGHSGTFAIAGMAEHAGAEGVGVYICNNNTWTQIAHWALTIGTTPYWLRMQYLDGFIVVHARAASNTTWVSLGSVVNATVPYSSDFSSRGALFMENVTAGSLCPMMDETMTSIPVEDNSIFPASDIVKIGEEYFSYTSKTANYRQQFDENWCYAANFTCGGEMSFILTMRDTVSFGIDNTSTAIRIPINSGYDDPAGIWMSWLYLPLCKVGMPTEPLWVGVYNGSGVLQASTTIAPELIADAPADGTVEYPKLFVMLKSIKAVQKALTSPEYDPNYVVVRKNTQTNYDANNYYKLQICRGGAPVHSPPWFNATNPQYWVRKYNTGTSAWVLVPNTWSDRSICNVRGWGDPFYYINVLAPNPDAHASSFVGGSYNIGNPPAMNRTKDLFLVKPSGPPNATPSSMVRQITSDADIVYYAGQVNLRIITVKGGYGVRGTTEVSGSDPTLPSYLTTDPVDKRHVQVYPALLNGKRGYNNSPVTSHVNELVYVFRPGPFVYTNELHYWTGDMDLSLDDLIREISVKSGYPSMTSNMLYPTSVTPSAANPVINSRNFIVKFSLAAAPTGTIVVEGRRDVGAARVKIELSNTSIKYYSGATLIQQYDLPLAGLFGDIVVSLFEAHVSIWRNQTLLHSFVLNTADAAYAGQYMTVSGTENSAIAVYLPEGNIRIDNYILDNNKTGLSLIDSLIGNKKFWFFDSNDQVKVVLLPTTVNTALTPYQLAILNNHSTSEMGAITRLRVEGAEISEVIDAVKMVEYGNLFHYINIPEINSQGDADYYAGINLAEAGSRYEVYTLQGAADPKIEPQDVIYVSLPEGVKKVLVDEITFVVDLQEEGGPVFDMTINGRVLRSDL